jgi:hypothetical protein
VRSTIALLITAIALAAAAGASATVAAPTLKITAGEPLTVRGAGFGSRTLVTVRVAVEGSRATKRVRSGAAGGFTVRFDSVSVYPCHITSIVARSATGRQASVKMPPAQCPQPPAP